MMDENAGTRADLDLIGTLRPGIGDDNVKIDTGTSRSTRLGLSCGYSIERVIALVGPPGGMKRPLVS